jgi:hypothetical protein
VEQVPIRRKTVIPDCLIGLTQENGAPAFVLLDQTGEAFVFPMSNFDAQKAQLIEMLTGGISVPEKPKIVVPGQ